MVFITGDTHGNPTRIVNFARNQDLTKDDVIVILGDVGANYYRGQRDKMMKQALAELAPTILCVYGNHEARPTSIPGYQQKEWLGGTVWYQPQYPNLLFANMKEDFFSKLSVQHSAAVKDIQDEYGRQKKENLRFMLITIASSAMLSGLVSGLFQLLGS